MLINADDAILMEDDEDLAIEAVGGAWIVFKQSIPSLQAKVLVHAFNLILLAKDPTDPPELDADSLLDRTNSFLPTDINNVLVDESMSIIDKKQYVFDALIDNTIKLLENLGFTINSEYALPEMLPFICKIGHFFYDMQGYQDLIGIVDALESTDISPADRFLLVLHRYLGEETDMTNFELLIEDVSEVTLKAIKDSMEGEDLAVGLPDNIIKRVRSNLDVLEGTLAYNHIKLNGQLGGSLDSFLNFFQMELKVIQENLEGENVLTYLKELIGFYLISDVNNPQIKERLLTTTYELIDDHVILVKAETIINQLVLTDD